MNDALIDDFFNELDGKIHNKKFTKELKDRLETIDKDELEELIKRHF